MTASQMIARLDVLVKEAGANYYERVRLTDALLQDRDWLLSQFRGDDYRAAEVLEKKYFHDLSGSMTVWMLLAVYRKFPDEADWKKHNHNLRDLYDKSRQGTTDRRTPRRTVKVTEFEAVQQKAKEVEFHNRKLSKDLKEREDELTTLRKKVEQLERENLRLKGRIEELERIVQGRLAG